MKKKIEVQYRMLLELLKASLSALPVNPDVFEGRTPAQWTACYQAARQQGVFALAWDGVLTLPAEMMPPRSLKVQWALGVERYEKVYQRYVKAVCDMTEQLAKKELYVAVLKGVGVSLWYPKPMHREGGDIDLYPYTVDWGSYTDEQAYNWSLSRLRLHGEGVTFVSRTPKHDVLSYEQIPVEYHRYFLELEGMKSVVFLNGLLKDMIEPEKQYFPDGRFIEVPSIPFQTVFLALHAMQHFGEGFTLHQVCDWACLLNRHGLWVPPGIRDKHVADMIQALTQFCNLYLGTHEEVNYSEELLDELVTELLCPPYGRNYEGMSKSTIFLTKCKRFLHYLRLRKKIVDEPYWTGIRRSVRYHWVHREACFGK